MSYPIDMTMQYLICPVCHTVFKRKIDQEAFCECGAQDSPIPELIRLRLPVSNTNDVLVAVFVYGERDDFVNIATIRGDNGKVSIFENIYLNQSYKTSYYPIKATPFVRKKVEVHARAVEWVMDKIVT